MSKESYLAEMKMSDVKSIGILMGKAIKDLQVKPDEYAWLCLKAKEQGFQFKDIVIVNN